MGHILRTMKTETPTLAALSFNNDLTQSQKESIKIAAKRLAFRCDRLSSCHARGLVLDRIAARELDLNEDLARKEELNPAHDFYWTALSKWVNSPRAFCKSVNSLRAF